MMTLFFIFLIDLAFNAPFTFFVLSIGSLAIISVGAIFTLLWNFGVYRSRDSTAAEKSAKPVPKDVDRIPDELPPSKDNPPDVVEDKALSELKETTEEAEIPSPKDTLPSAEGVGAPLNAAGPSPTIKPSPLDPSLSHSLEVSVGAQYIFDKLPLVFEFFIQVMARSVVLKGKLDSLKTIKDSDREAIDLLILGAREAVRYMILSLVRDAWIMNHPSYKYFRDLLAPYALMQPPRGNNWIGKIDALLKVLSRKKYGVVSLPVDRSMLSPEIQWDLGYYKLFHDGLANLTSGLREVHPPGELRREDLRHKSDFYYVFCRYITNMTNRGGVPSELLDSSSVLVWLESRGLLLGSAYRASDPESTKMDAFLLRSRPANIQTLVLGLDVGNFLKHSQRLVQLQAQVFGLDLEFKSVVSARDSPFFTDLLASAATNRSNIKSVVEADPQFPKSQEILESTQSPSLLLTTPVEGFETESFISVWSSAIRRTLSLLKDLF